MPRRSRNTNFLPQASSSSNDPRLDLQNVESARNAESLGRNVRRRLAPTTAENAIDFIDSVNVHSSRNGFSGIQTARTMPEECAERLIGPARQANLGSEGQTVNQPVPSVGGRLGSGANDVTSPFHPSQLSENVLHHVSGMLRWIDILSLQYQINLVLHGPEVDEGNLEESEDDVVLHGSEVEVEVDKGNLEDLEHDVGLQGSEVDEVNLEDSEDDVVLHGSEVDVSDLEDWEDDVVLHGSEVDESDLEDSENDVYQGIHLDDLTHEELLAFGEDIGEDGDAEIRLNEEAILAGVGRHSYQSPNLGSPEEEECCCICLENYVEGEELGRLDCRHEFHFNCLELWLLQKNACPLCKRAAVAI